MSEKKNKKSNKKNSSNKNKNFTSIQSLPESFLSVSYELLVRPVRTPCPSLTDYT